MTLSYEKAKELKEAGFPYPNSDDSLVGNKYVGDLVGVKYYSPELSELIAACGEDFLQLTQTSPDMYRNSPWSWCATSGSERMLNDEGNPKPFVGNTPEEAVANLWLALNKRPG